MNYGKWSITQKKKHSKIMKIVMKKVYAENKTILKNLSKSMLNNKNSCGKRSIESKKRYKIAALKRWKNKGYREKVIKNVMKALFNNRPTSLEKQMITIIKKNKLPFIYTGDGSFLVGYKNPDFIHINKKIAIEVANLFHHSKEYEPQRKKHFNNYGWQVFVFFEDNNHILDEEKILSILTKL